MGHVLEQVPDDPIPVQAPNGLIRKRRRERTPLRDTREDAGIEEREVVDVGGAEEDEAGRDRRVLREPAAKLKQKHFKSRISFSKCVKFLSLRICSVYTRVTSMRAIPRRTMPVTTTECSVSRSHNYTKEKVDFENKKWCYPDLKFCSREEKYFLYEGISSLKALSLDF